jgi:glycosyltransferase involved in cell wall biosynthesis
VQKANGGAANARNFGIAHSTGELIAFLDADDYWEPQRLERQLEVLHRHPEVGLVASRFYLQELGRPRFEPFPLDGHLFDRVQKATGAVALSVARRTWTSSVLMRRSVLGAHRFDESLRTAEDVELWLRLALEVPVYLTSEPLATGVLTPGSLSRADVAGDYQNMLHVVQRNADLIGPAALRAWELSLYREWAAGHLGRGEPRAALRPALERLRRQPWSPQGWWILCKSAAIASFSQSRSIGTAEKGPTTAPSTVQA